MINFLDKIVEGIEVAFCILLSLILFIISLPIFVVCLVLLPVFIFLGILADAIGAD